MHAQYINVNNFWAGYCRAECILNVTWLWVGGFGLNTSKLYILMKVNLTHFALFKSFISEDFEARRSVFLYFNVATKPLRDLTNILQVRLYRWDDIDLGLVWVDFHVLSYRWSTIAVIYYLLYLQGRSQLWNTKKYVLIYYTLAVSIYNLVIGGPWLISSHQVQWIYKRLFLNNRMMIRNCKLVPDQSVLLSGKVVSTC